MAISKLSTNFIDDIIDTSVNAHRRYQMTAVSGQADTYELEETTTFIQKGTDYNANVVNTTNGTVNSLIDIAEADATTIAEILDGTTAVARAGYASTATSATTANSANTATSAGSANTATSAGFATTATTANSANSLSTARKINGVDFDGTQDIVVVDNTKVPLTKDFILINQQNLTFVNNKCRIDDSKITASSLADVYFTTDTINYAKIAEIVAETYAGYVELTATNTPSQTLVATIHIRVN